MDTSKLTPANENPWYVLMTLYGEQEGERVDDDLHDKNRAVWNAWSCQALDDAAAAELAKQAEVGLAETRGWAEIATKIKRKHRAEMKKRNGDDFTYPGFPDVEAVIGCLEIQFFNTVVLRNCIFRQRANFSSATFTQDAYFTFATFTQDASFSSATFTEGAYFTSATFAQEAVFSAATFKQYAWFFSATFMQDAYFTSTAFDGPAKFEGTQFGERGADEACVAYFAAASFARLASFRDATFATHYPVLEGVEFRETLVVTARKDNWPDAADRLLEAPTEDNPYIPTNDVSKESRATLRHMMGKQGMPEEEHFFFRREMRFAGHIGGWFERLPYRLFGAVSGYGYSIARPANLLLALWLGALLVFTEGAGMGLGEALGYSFANMFKFFGLHRTYFDYEMIRGWPAWVQWVSGAQTVLAFILLFFLGLGLRTRFRLR